MYGSGEIQNLHSRTLGNAKILGGYAVCLSTAPRSVRIFYTRCKVTGLVTGFGVYIGLGVTL